MRRVFLVLGFEGVVALILGVMVWRHWPSSSLWVIGSIMGTDLDVTGITRLMTLAAPRLTAALAI